MAPTPDGGAAQGGSKLRFAARNFPEGPANGFVGLDRTANPIVSWTGL